MIQPSPDFPPVSWSDPVNHNNRVVRDDPFINPFTVIIDTREQNPWTFRNLKCDSDRKYRPLCVNTTRATLKTGDYSIEGFESRICIERKSLSDAFGTFVGDRERFIAELERMRSFEFSAVIIECETGYADLILGPQRIDQTKEHSKVVGKTMFRGILAWMVRYPMVQWLPMPGRDVAEQTCFRLLERFWNDERERVKVAAKARQGTLNL